MKLSISKLHRDVSIAAIAAYCAMPAWAQTLGGLQKGQQAGESIKTGLFALVGVVALIYLIYLGAMAFTEKKSWSDFGWGVVHVSIVGGSLALGNWAWTLFQ